MSSQFPPDDQNPFSSPVEGYQPAPMEPGTAPTRDSIDYFYSYNYVFENQNWITTLLLASLVVFIPIIGPIVVMGYHYDIIAAIALGKVQTYPDFDFNKFGDYLIRGIWVFLVGLIAILCMLPLYFLFVIGVAIAGSIHELLALIAVFVFFFLVMVVYIVTLFGCIPLQLRAGLTKDFGQIYNFAFIRDFVSKMWVEELLCMLFITISSWVVAMAGFFMFCIGIYPAMVLVGMAFAHLQLQLYQVYLSRGGQPIPIAE